MIALLVREAGKTLPDAIAELREAVDYCRYYAAAARRDFEVQALPGPTGEDNSLALAGRGVFVCISPWNFPLAIFLGQVAAALVAGNTVVAKPAPQTPLIAARAVAILHRAGVPAEALHLLPGGPELGATLVAHPAVAGIAFTGSTATAQAINRTLAARNGPIATLIAETGGMNAIIADNSALAEQLVDDVIASSFLSAGQRCSACRLLFVPEEAAPRTIEMLAGALDELVIGDPGLPSTDIGPVIDEAARARLDKHLHAMGNVARLVARAKLPAACANGSFFAPAILELDRADRLASEVFGPILHVVRYRAGHLDQVIDTINAMGYGLTLGVHSRIGATIEAVRRGVRVGNLYVNRSIIGATVGVQPFGGEGLSGTGPKAGGPNYVRRFAVERTISVDTTSAGGNTTLLSLPEDN
jgi:RHH-type proline utilization regulon transcriptional repressor/proline dehydrogenase/delta 1-pyrroline-5-carboxylate dehydrogenase